MEKEKNLDNAPNTGSNCKSFFCEVSYSRGSVSTPCPCWIFPGLLLSHGPLLVLCGASSRVPKTGATATIPRPFLCQESKNVL